MTLYTDIVTPPEGIVSLSDKQIPICETKEPYESYYAYTRGQIDVSGFKSYLQSLPESIWDDKHQVGNVQLTRPAHDRWGIKKIIFTFCDDFLQKVFDLPWSQQLEWKQYLLPIYHQIGISEHQIVRSLLASMPPGVTIPIHHDTGYWVKKTHRLHVAIITGEQVDFLVGPTETQMKKYTLDEGRIVELNNQAKHAVMNNMTSLSRVHLIFDYIEIDYNIPRRVLLKAGERINQTRRSIDLASEEGQRKSPSFIIIGAQKCGTTSMYEYLCSHPLVVPAGRRETHYFDWRWNSKLMTSAEQLIYYMKFFDQQVIEKNPSLLTGESTPSYLLHSDIVIPRMLQVCPWVKLLIILRNPVERAYSQYNMCIDMSGTPEQLQTRGLSQYIGKTFETVVEEEILHLQQLGITENSTYEEFQRLVLPHLPMNHGGHSIIIRGLYALQIMPYLQLVYPHITPLSTTTTTKTTTTTTVNSVANITKTTSHNIQLQIYDISQIKGSLSDINYTINSIYNYVGLPPHDLEITDTKPKNTRDYQPMRAETRQKLEAFYKPYNEKLHQLLSHYGLAVPSSF